jgi:predicted ABC-class ATPase
MLVEYLIKEDVTVDGDFVRKARTELQGRRKGRKYFVLVEGVGFFNVTSEARALIACAEVSNHLAAIAFYTTNYSLKLLAGMYNQINKPSVITHSFINRDEAVDWLYEMMRINACFSRN